MASILPSRRESAVSSNFTSLHEFNVVGSDNSIQVFERGFYTVGFRCSLGGLSHVIDSKFLHKHLENMVVKCFPKIESRFQDTVVGRRCCSER